ncbi:MAG: YpsA SLOG family protein [Pseudanabaena sp.]
MTPSVALIISGGQTGADWGGLLAAADVGIATGGLAPKGYLTELGANLELAEFGLVESDSADYEVRTVHNVLAADATVIFADHIHSDGTKLTIASCIKHQKPYLINPDAPTLHDWLLKQKVKVLNVAGNRESVAQGIGDRVRSILREALC